jgi:CheY-like chemotaxis protein
MQLEWRHEEQLQVLTVAAEPALQELVQRCLLPDQAVTVVGRSDGSDATSSLSRCEADVVLMDVLLPRTNALALTQRLRAFRPDVQVVLLGVQDSAYFDAVAAASGAAAFIALEHQTPAANRAAVGDRRTGRRADRQLAEAA